MTDLVKVSRRIMRPTELAHVTSRYGGINLRLRLADEEKFQMGGEESAYFCAEYDYAKKSLTFGKRVPTPEEAW